MFYTQGQVFGVKKIGFLGCTQCKRGIAKKVEL
jgi:hypothetical protein